MRMLVAKVRDIPIDRNRWGKFRLDQNDVLDPLVRFQEQRPRGALEPVYGDLWFLYRQVRLRRPRIVLEFGSGCSTLVLAKALADNRHGSLYSVDSSEEWADATARCIPSDLRYFARVSASTISRTTTLEHMDLLRHESIPDVVPDFVFLDGPPLKTGEVAVDLLDMEPKVEPGFMLVIDKRKENTKFLRTHFKRDYTFKSGRLSVFLLRG